MDVKMLKIVARKPVLQKRLFRHTFPIILLPNRQGKVYIDKSQNFQR